MLGAKHSAISYCHRPGRAIALSCNLGEHNACFSRPPFQPWRAGSSTHCSQRANAGMENVRSKTCLQPGCITRASFGMNDGSKKAEFCSQHAAVGMVDVVGRRCSQGCIKKPSYGIGYGDKKAAYCSKHAKLGRYASLARTGVFKKVAGNSHPTVWTMGARRLAWSTSRERVAHTSVVPRSRHNTVWMVAARKRSTAANIPSLEW